MHKPGDGPREVDNEPFVFEHDEAAALLHPAGGQLALAGVRKVRQRHRGFVVLRSAARGLGSTGCRWRDQQVQAPLDEPVCVTSKLDLIESHEGLPFVSEQSRCPVLLGRQIVLVKQ
jgi:hypothetical protein